MPNVKICVHGIALQCTASYIDITRYVLILCSQLKIESRLNLYPWIIDPTTLLKITDNVSTG